MRFAKRIYIVLSNEGGELNRVEVRQNQASDLIELTHSIHNAANVDLNFLLNNLRPGDTISIEERETEII